MIDRYEISISAKYSRDLLFDYVLALTVRYGPLRNYLFLADNRVKIMRKDKISHEQIRYKYLVAEDDFSGNESFGNFDFPLFSISVIEQIESFRIFFDVHKIISCELNIMKVLHDLEYLFVNDGRCFWKTDDFKLVNLRQEILDKLSVEVEDIYPLSYKQKALLAKVLARRNSDIGLFEKINHITFATVEFQYDLFIEALNLAIHGADMLRSVYMGRLHYQVILRNVDCECRLMDLSGYTEEEKLDRMKYMVQEMQKEGFHFESENLFKCVIVKIEQNKYDFVTYHHIGIMDGNSYDMFVNRIFNNYVSLLDGVKIPQKETGNSYRDYVLEELNIISNNQTERYWQDKLLQISACNTEFRKSDRQIEFVTGIYYEMPDGLQTHLKTFTFNKPKSLIYLAALFILCHETLENQTVVIGVTTNTKTYHEIMAETIGYFSNTVPYIIDFIDISNAYSLIDAIHTQYIENKQFELYPISNICKVCFTYVNYAYDKMETEWRSGIKFLEPVLSTCGHTSSSFYLTVKERPHTIKISIECGDNLFSKEELGKVVESYNNILEHLIHELSYQLN